MIINFTGLGDVHPSKIIVMFTDFFSYGIPKIAENVQLH